MIHMRVNPKPTNRTPIHALNSNYTSANPVKSKNNTKKKGETLMDEELRMYNVREVADFFGTTR